MDDTMNQKEKVIGLSYVVLLFVGITAICCFLLFNFNSNFAIFNQKSFAMEKMQRIKEYQNIQSQYSATVDSLYDKIRRYNPAIQAVYEENDIKFMVNELNNVYEQHTWDARYKSFLHISRFYFMWFNDKRDFQAKKSNLQILQKSLNECEIGLETRKNELLNSPKY